MAFTVAVFAALTIIPGSASAVGSRYFARSAAPGGESGPPSDSPLLSLGACALVAAAMLLSASAGLAVGWFAGRRRPVAPVVADAPATGSELAGACLAEQASRQSEERFHQMADAMPQMVWTARADGYVDYHNERWYEFTGFDRSLGGDQSWIEILHPDDRPACLQKWYNSVRTGEPYQIEYRFRDRHTGDYRWHLGRALPLRDAAGRVVRWFGTCTDIDGQKKAEQEVRRVNEELEARVLERTQALRKEVVERQQAEAALSVASSRLQAVLDAATQVAIIATDPEGLITVFNAGAERMLGYPAAELVGKQTPALIHLPSEMEEHSRSLTAHFGTPIAGFDTFVAHARQGGYEEREWTYVRKDWTRLSVSLVVTAIRDEKGSICGFLGVARDVTARARIEKELRQAKETAEAANRAKSDFLANMSHEIRTPMNGVIGLTELALDTELTDEQRDFLQAVKSSADALLRVINEILDFSKVEAGMIVLDPQPFDLRDGLADTLRPLAHRSHRKGLELALHVRPDVPQTVVADLSRLRQVVINLVGNAIKFTHTGEVLLEVRVSRLAPSSVELHFAVSDTGIGIPEDKVQAIFAPFAQADGSTTRDYGGTGLGLSISSRLVGLMGGAIWVESQPDVGSTFNFTIPCGLAADAPQAPAAGGLAGERVLVVDDNATNRGILQELLEHWGMRVSAAEDLAQARRELDAPSDPIRLVLLDATLPENDAFTLAEYVRRLPGGDEIKLLLLTGEPDRGNASRWEALQLAAQLAKPVKQSHLLEAMQSVLGHPVSARPSSCKPLSRPSLFKSSRPARLRLLLAEDNVVNQLVSRKTLEKQGHSVVVVNTGLEALAAIERYPFDLVLMDVQMPELDGLEATRRLRLREKGTGKHLPVVALTAHAFASDRQRCLEAGMDGYVTKPFQSVELHEAMQTAMKGEAPSLPARPSPAAAFDRAAFLARMGGDQTLMQQIIEIFRRESEAALTSLRGSLEGLDHVGVERSAHKIKGSLALFAAADAREAAARLEKMAREADLAQAGATLADLERAIHALEPELAALLSHTP